MRRITLMVTLALLFPQMTVLSAFPAFAEPPVRADRPNAANERASCMGQIHSGQSPKGAAGYFHSTRGRADLRGSTASSFARFGEEGQDRKGVGIMVVLIRDPATGELVPPTERPFFGQDFSFEASVCALQSQGDE
jgi:hypothetical protein